MRPKDFAAYYYQCDQIGAPQELTDEQGRIVWAASYRVWGQMQALQVMRTGTDDATVFTQAERPLALAAQGHIQSLSFVEQPLRFQGQYFDGETGLHYNRHRYYDPVTGRFVHQDPIGILGGINFYEFGPNSSMWIDPLGMAKKLPRGTYETHSTRTKPAQVNGRSVINKCYAGKVFPAEHLPKEIRGKYPHGVPFNMQGFPDFSRYALTTVQIEPGSSRGTDFSRANAEAFGKGNPYGSSSPTIDGKRYTWNHYQDSGKMQLIPEDIHEAVKHTGGFSKNCP
ncbi:RHS repeat-associated core domain-containing protein [Paracidovorax citrulli]|uniref:RHS repeat-associated core domain-containing protein n=2 Tax=Paracidovorax citrulli TaxID=80869 RepID=UPI00094399F7|nr:RHS repeat-associated core domain-containing protein [Paracidovorax citrulli]UMT89194.1 hypothetical protein FRC90_14700 [Paracidovorax citrulli]WIY36056.1 RHS repeat-associated core domain-containing protein [Paracidovorax citrulli]